MLYLRLALLFALGFAASCSDDGSNKAHDQGGAHADDEANDDEANDDEASDDSSAEPGTLDAGSKGSLDAKVANPGLDAASPLDAGAPSDAGAGGMDVQTRPAREGGAPHASEMHSVHVDGPDGGMDRTFLLYIPSGLDKDVPVPLISVHHGFTMSGDIMERISTWDVIAEREGVVIAYPDGGNDLAPWNVGDGVCDPGSLVAADPTQDDLGFVKAIIDAADEEQAIDRAHVFVGGFSMGGYFANNVGCKGRDFVRAVSAHSGGTYPGDCPGHPVPVLLIHGDSDGLIPYDPCAKDAYGYWIQRNACGTDVDTDSIKGGSCDWNKDCPAGQELGFCTMKGMDHGWAGAPTNGPGAWLTAPVVYAASDGQDLTGYGGGTDYADAAELMWKFFARYW